MSRKPRILYVAHGHPAVRPGGAEQHALELYRGMKQAGEFDVTLLARCEERRRSHSQVRFRSLPEDPGQVLLHTDGGDGFLLSQTDRSILTTDLNEFLRGARPDIVHFQHTMHIGIEALWLVRSVLPRAPIVLTLHEYLYICNADGQMLRRHVPERCLEASPARCHKCFPDRPPRDFFLRERYLKRALAHVSRFVAPSRFLLERYVDWGLSRDRLLFLDYGRHVPEPAPPRDVPIGEPRNRFGYFGQVNPYKGVIPLLEAMCRLSERTPGRIHLFLNGANLENQVPELRRRCRDLLAACPDVTDLGPYPHERLAERMALVDWVVVPSVWWENSPLVIQEAFLHRRPVLCSDIGGMSEKVRDGVDGLHFRAGDPDSIADTLVRAARTEGLWKQLREGIRYPPTIDEAVAAHSAMYRQLLGIG